MFALCKQLPPASSFSLETSVVQWSIGKEKILVSSWVSLNWIYFRDWWTGISVITLVDLKQLNLYAHDFGIAFDKVKFCQP